MALGKMYKAPVPVKMVKSAKGLNKLEKKEVKSIVYGAVETKYGYFETGINVTATPTILSLFDITQGDGVTNNRIGNKVSISSIHIDYRVNTGDEFNGMRLILFQWFQDTSLGPLPTVNDILQPTSFSTPLNAPYAFEEVKKYRILYDKLHNLAGDGAVGGGAYVISPYGPATSDSRRFVKTKGFVRPVSFDDADETGKNKIYMLCVSDSPGVSLVHPTLSMTSVIKYKDV